MNKKGLLIAMAGLGILVISFVIIRMLLGVGGATSKLNIDVAPTIAGIAIDGARAHAGINKVSPGRHTITVELTGFSTVKQAVTAQDNQSKYVGIVLTSSALDTADWYHTHPSDQQKAEQITGRNYDNISQQAMENVPLIKELPFIGAGFEFRVDYGNPPNGGDPSKPAIYIQASTPKGQQDALAWIKNQGYDISKLQIVYQNTTP